MSFPNHLPTESYEGTIDGIAVRWAPNAKNNLPEDARYYQQDMASLKGATEHLAVSSAKRLQKTGVKIMGSFHDKTVVSATGQVLADGCHCSISLTPGQLNAHIYVNLTVAMPLHEMQVLGESVVPPRATGPDPTLSTGNYTHR